MVKTEMIHRLELRDNAIVLYLGAISAVLGFVTGTGVNTEFLLIIPLLAFGATSIVEQHNILIGLLGQYFRKELDPVYQEIDEFATQWDGSEALLEKAAQWPLIFQRKYAHLILLIWPPILSLIINFHHLYNVRSILQLASWWIGAALTAASVWLILETNRLRDEMYK
jgi:hypothetical protein